MLNEELNSDRKISSLVATRIKSRTRRNGNSLSELDAHMLSFILGTKSPEEREKDQKVKKSSGKKLPLIISTFWIVTFFFLSYSEFKTLTDELSLSEFEDSKEIVSDKVENTLVGDQPLSEEEIREIQNFTKVSNELKEEKKEKITDPTEGMLHFIAGVIAVHLPESVDSGTIAREIVETSKEEKVDPLFVAAIISVESRFSNKATSSVGAQGLMQLMPGTARLVANKIFGTNKKLILSNSKLNIKLGINYLHELKDQYNGDKKLMLAAYNWGPANVSKALKGEKRIPSSVNHYANTIIKKTKAWNYHFSSTKKE